MVIIDFKKFKKEFHCNDQCISELNSKEIWLSKSFFDDKEYEMFLEFFRNPRNFTASKSEVLYPKVIVKTKLFKIIYPDALVSKIEDKKVFISLNNYRIIKEKSDSNIWIKLIMDKNHLNCELKYFKNTVLNSENSLKNKNSKCNWNEKFYDYMTPLYTKQTENGYIVKKKY